MANYTCTTNMTLEACITAGPMVSGDNLTINSGATVTCDRTPSILIGVVTINYGKLFIDGINIGTGNMINFVGEYAQTITVNGQGELDVNGKWYTLGTTDGTNAQVFNLATYYDSSFCVDTVPMIQVETGRRLDFNNSSGITPEVDDWIFKTSDRTIMGRIVEVHSTYLVVKFLTGTLANTDEIHVRKIIDNNGPDLQKSWTADINNASGDIKETGIYQEFGNSVINGVSQLSAFHHGVGGFAFANIFQSTTLTMGTATGTTGGFVPPSGCNVRIPNIHFSTSNITNYASNNTYNDGTINEYNRYNLSTASAGKVNFSLCNIGSAFFGCASANEFKCYNVGATISIGSAIAGTKTIYHNCCVCVDPLDLAASSQPFHLTDLVNGTEVKDCLAICGAALSNFAMTSSTDVSIIGCISSNAGSGTNISIRGPLYNIVRCKNVVFNNNVAISNLNSTTYPFLTIQTSENVSINNFIVGTQTNTTQTWVSSGITINEFSKNIEIIGMEIISAGLPGRWFIQTDDVIDLRVRCVGLIDDPIDFGTLTDEFITLSGTSSKISIARCWKKNGQTKTFQGVATYANDIEVLNCGADYATFFRAYSLDNYIIKGLHAGSGTPGSTTGIEELYPACYGYQFTDGFRSDVVGFIVCNMKPPSADINYVTITAGNPLFYNNGYLDMTSGDVIEFEMSYFALGHISFPGTYTSVLGVSGWNVNEWTNVTVDFQYDIGSGWNGSWLDARTVSNWTGISVVAATGVKLKYRFTATGTSTSMTMFIIDTVTSLAAQKANWYPIDQITCDITLNGIVVGSRYWIYDSDTSAELAEGTASTTSPEITVICANNTNLLIRVRKSSAATKYFPFKTTAVSNTTSINVAIIQVEDGIAT
ncbi:hypothetical protein GQ473_04705 [archaeon]|nr:hypothetical protein [archaeon]